MPQGGQTGLWEVFLISASQAVEPSRPVNICRTGANSEATLSFVPCVAILAFAILLPFQVSSEFEDPVGRGLWATQTRTSCTSMATNSERFLQMQHEAPMTRIDGAAARM
eukprot:1201917-Amphidinium_carterae.1